MRRTFLADSLLILVLSTILIWPLFRLKYMDNWPSIESTFISDARMLGEHLPHPGWQPLWYCGTRYDYIYPPALRYGPALIAKTARLTPARAYHLYIAFLYIFGIAAVYWLVLAGTGSRASAYLATAATALLSPSFLMLKAIRHDSTYWVPQRLHALVLYGEGPHISALCVLTAALAASFLVLRKWRPGMFALAGILCALAVTNNFYGATALAIFFPTMAWAIWNGERDWRILPRAAGIAALAYGLCAFWLTPSYLKYTVINLKWVAQPSHAWSWITAILLVAAFGAVSYKLGNRRPEREWAIFVAGVAIFLTVDVVGNYFFDFRVVGEPMRFVPELDLALILAFAEIVRLAWRRPKWRIAAAIVVAAAFLPSLKYLPHAWTPYPKAGSLESQYPYQMSKWIHDNLPGQRVLPTGELRFWFDAWWDNAQADGGSLQGMENQIIPLATWQILGGDKPGFAIQWLQALGTDAAVVAGPKSLEYYRDYTYPDKYKSVLPVLYDNGQGTTVYRIPRIYPNIGRIVDTKAIAATPKFNGGVDAEGMAKYLAIVENPDQPATTVAWHGFDEVDVQAKTTPGRSILLQETYDASWRATENGMEIPVRLEPVMGFMLIDVPEGDHLIKMQFETPLENRAGQWLLVLSLLTVAGFGVVAGLRRFR